MKSSGQLDAILSQRDLIEKAQSYIGSYLPPDGISKDELINEFIGLFDGPEQRDVAKKVKFALEGTNFGETE